MHAMITAYREDNGDVKFKFIQIERCDKWTKKRTALAKNSSGYDSNATPSAASEGCPIGQKKAKSMRDTAPAIKKLHSSIMACMANAAPHAAIRAEQAANMEEIATARWASVRRGRTSSSA
jgi:hypothetical protein